MKREGSPQLQGQGAVRLLPALAPHSCCCCSFLPEAEFVVPPPCCPSVTTIAGPEAGVPSPVLLVTSL